MIILERLRELAWSGVPSYVCLNVWRLLLKPRFIHCSLGGTVVEPKATAAVEPLLLNSIRGQDVERPPVWLMRQIGRAHV